MQEVEIFCHTEMWPKGLSGNNGYETLQIYREPEFRFAAPLVILMYQLAAGQSQLLTPKGLCSHSLMKYPLCVPF